jgi:hypothetical protein
MVHAWPLALKDMQQPQQKAHSACYQQERKENSQGNIEPHNRDKNDGIDQPITLHCCLSVTIGHELFFL